MHHVIFILKAQQAMDMYMKVRQQAVCVCVYVCVCVSMCERACMLECIRLLMLSVCELSNV